MSKSLIYLSSALCLLLIGLEWPLAYAHVALVYPPARKYDLDFLDSVRTPGPCGMPQGEERTTIVAGSTFNVTWRLGYPHKGGYKLQLLTDEGRPWMDLTPSSGPKGFVRDDVTAQEYQVQIPRNVSCKGCSIRLQREALEWSNDYIFWSCADVNIVHEEEYKENCSGHGILRNGVCVCKKLYTGPRCQYKDECWEDKDCGINGKCINIKATTYPEKQCFCQLGWFGENCSKESLVDTIDINLSKHESQKLSETFTLYWKVLPALGEIEIVSRVKTTTWVGLGWRPQGLTANCRAFPPIEDHVVFESTVEGVGVAEPHSIPESQSVPEPQSIPEPIIPASSTTVRVTTLPLNKEDRSRTIVENQSNDTEFVAHNGNVTEVELGADDVAVLEEAAIESKLNSSKNEGFEGRTFNYSYKESPTSEAIATEGPKINEFTEDTAESNRHHVTLEVSAHPMQVKTEEQSEASDRSYAEEPQQGEVSYGHNADEELVEYMHKTEAPVSSGKSRAKRGVVSHNGTNKAANVSSTSPKPIAEPQPQDRKGKALPNSDAHPKPESNPANFNVSSDFEPATAESKMYKSGPYTPKNGFHAMDCTDLVIGMAYGNYSRVFDYYTRDRSTPRVDSFWGGTDSLTSAAGFEKDGYTTIMFRRKLKAHELTDHSFTKGLMHVIWAKGQEPGAYHHNPLSGLELDKPKVPDFYRRDELKYHGHSIQRGVTTVDFLSNQNLDKQSMDESKGEWKTPESCAIDDCEYRATWEYIPSQDSILFTVSTNNSDKWTGIAFSENTAMPKTDAILGWVDEAGRTFVMDVWFDNYTAPSLDRNQDVNGIKGSKRSGRVSLTFTRKRNTGDPEDLAFTDSSCLYMMFPFNGGLFNAVNKKIRQHQSTPAVSKTKICIRGGHTGGVTEDASDDDANSFPSFADVVTSVNLPQTTSPASTVDPKPASLYMVSIRLPNQTLDEAIERGTDFKMLIREDLNNYIGNALQHIQGFKKAEVTALDSEKNEAHVVAKMRIYVDSSLHSKETSKHFVIATVNQLNKTISSTLSKRKVGRLIVDPDYLIIDPPQVAEVPEPTLNDFGNSSRVPASSNARTDETMFYVIIAAVAALLLLLFVQIICMLCKCSGSRRSNLSKERLIVGGNGWKDYAAGTSPGNGSTYDYEHNYNSSHKEDTPKLGKYPAGSTNGYSASHNSQGGNNGYNSKTGETRSLNRNPRGRLSMEPDRSHYSRRSESLPRPQVTSEVHSYDTHDRAPRPSSASSMYPQGGLQPDFYFMPSQRRYSGEVVRVYVDYDNPNYSAK